MVCDRCGFIVHKRYMKRQYNGMYCCNKVINDCWEKEPRYERPIIIPGDKKPLKPGHANDYGFTEAAPYTGQGTDL